MNRPHLTREETNERMRTLGFTVNPDGTLEDTEEGRLKFVAIQELIAGGIADWADPDPYERDGNYEEKKLLTTNQAWERLNEELQTSAQEYLVG